MLSFSSHLIASCRWCGVIRFTFQSLPALPATSAVRYSSIAAVYTAAIAPTLPLGEELVFKRRRTWPTWNCTYKLHNLCREYSRRVEYINECNQNYLKADAWGARDRPLLIFRSSSSRRRGFPHYQVFCSLARHFSRQIKWNYLMENSDIEQMTFVWFDWSILLEERWSDFVFSVLFGLTYILLEERWSDFWWFS